MKVRAGEAEARGVVRLERAVSVLLGVTILLVAAGSSWSPGLKSDVSNLRWLALFALAAASVLLAFTVATRLPLSARERWGAILAIVFVALCLLSTGWSVDPRLTIERAVTVAAVFVVTASLAFAADRRPELVVAVSRSILAAIGVLVAASLVLVLVDPAASAQTGVIRFRGVGENPDTLALLAAYALPLGAWRFLDSRHRGERAAVVALTVGVLVLIGASGSRGGLVAGVAGTLVFVAAEQGREPLRALAAGAAVVAVLGATLLITPLVAHVPGVNHDPVKAAAVTLPVRRPTRGITAKTSRHRHRAARRRPTPRVVAIQNFWPMAMTDELGRPRYGAAGYATVPGGHNLLSSSGRVQAWGGAVDQADQRPFLGYGFGTEDHVFIDRWYFYDSARAENSFIGTYLMVGLVGLASLCALLAWAVVGGLKALRDSPSRRRAVAATGGVVAAGLVEMVVQSFVSSAGDIAMLSFWVCVALVGISPRWALPEAGA